eukprot:tig00000189_g14343.t1
MAFTVQQRQFAVAFSSPAATQRPARRSAVSASNKAALVPARKQRQQEVSMPSHLSFAPMAVPSAVVLAKGPSKHTFSRSFEYSSQRIGFKLEPSSIPGFDALGDGFGKMVPETGFGFILGLATGYTAKQITKKVLLFIGITFIMVQLAARSGFISVNWTKIEDKVTSKLDANEDGKLDYKDFVLLAKKGLSALTENLHSTAGFGTGAFIGVKYL